MSTHTGVSCDACMISNFPGRRYKCLVCVNYDLCGTCYDAEAESQNHKNNHPMQCLLTDTAAEFFYTGETSGRRGASSLTCPYCAQAGFTPRTLMAHCIEKHSASSAPSKTDQVVMCPICVTSPAHRSRSRFASLADHIAAVHDDGSLGDERDPFASPFAAQQPQRQAEEEEDSDDEEADEDDDAALTLNDVEQQALAEIEQRRQEIARQRVVNASSLAAAVLNSHTNNSNTQRRPLSRQTAIRLARGSFRSHFNNFPYGSSSRGGGSQSNSSSSSRNANDPTTLTPSQAAAFHDPFSTSLSADPMLDYVSQLMTNQPTSTAGQWSFMSPFPTQYSPSTGSNIVDYARLQQQLDGSENNTQINSLRATLLNAKQKRSSQNQQQQQPPSSQPAVAGATSGQDLPTWQQHLSNIQRVMNLTNVFGDNFTLESNTNQTPTINANLRHVQSSQRESGPQSLLEKMLKCELTVNKEEANDPARTQQQQQDRLGLLRSILLSSMTIPNDDNKDDESQSTFNKENQL